VTLVLSESKVLRIGSMMIFYIAQGLPIGAFLTGITSWISENGQSAGAGRGRRRHDLHAVELQVPDRAVHGSLHLSGDGPPAHLADRSRRPSCSPASR